MIILRVHAYVQWLYLIWIKKNKSQNDWNTRICSEIPNDISMMKETLGVND